MNDVFVVEPEPQFEGKLYEGSTVEGWICFQKKYDEALYTVLYDSIWFQLA